MKNLPLLIGTIVGTLILIIAVAVLSSGGGSASQEQQVVDMALVAGDARHSSLTAKAMMQETLDISENQATESSELLVPSQVITIVEFSDFQCPACKAALPAVERVKAVYPDEVNLIYRHFPLDSIHPNARLAAISTEAVASLDESKFWLMHDKLFAEQESWSTISSRSELKDAFATYAVELGLDRAQFLEKMESDSVAELVNLDVAAGTQLGVNSTPTFYVNGVKTSAPQLLQAVESLLSE